MLNLEPIKHLVDDDHLLELLELPQYQNLIGNSCGSDWLTFAAVNLSGCYGISDKKTLTILFQKNPNIQILKLIGVVIDLDGTHQSSLTFPSRNGKSIKLKVSHIARMHNWRRFTLSSFET